MTPSEIQDALKEKKITQGQVATDLGVSEMTVSKVVNKIIVSDRVMRHLASVIGKDHREVFPEYYLQPPKRSTSKVACG